MIPQAEWISLPEEQGLADVKEKLETGQFQPGKFKIMILITGQAKVAAGHPAIANCVQLAISSVKLAYPKAVILLCSPLPRPKDGPDILKDMDNMGDVMYRLCAEDKSCEYARLGMYFYGQYHLAESLRRRTKAVHLVNQELIQGHGLMYEGVQ